MAIIFPLNFPTVGGIKKAQFTQKVAVASSRQEFSGERLTVRHPKQVWGLQIESVPLRRAQADEWNAFILSLNGKEGTFLFNDPFFTSPRGVATGTPQIKGASETGQDINTDGWTVSTTGILLKNDWIQISSGNASRLYKVLADANSDSNGDATLTLYPRIEEAFADNTAITVSSPKGVFRMMENEHSWDTDPRKLIPFTILAESEQ